MIKPLRDFIVVQPIVMPLSDRLIVQNKEPFNRGQVLAVGTGLPSKKGFIQPMTVKVGDWIRYGNGSYLDWAHVDMDGVKVQLIREPDVVGIEIGD